MAVAFEDLEGRIRVVRPDGHELAAAERRRLAEAIAGQLATSIGSRGGLDRADVVDVVAAMDWSSGTPTQEAAADAAFASTRRIRQLQGPGGWQGILEDATRRRASDRKR